MEERARPRTPTSRRHSSVKSMERSAGSERGVAGEGITKRRLRLPSQAFREAGISAFMQNLGSGCTQNALLIWVCSGQCPQFLLPARCINHDTDCLLLMWKRLVLPLSSWQGPSSPGFKILFSERPPATPGTDPPILGLYAFCFIVLWDLYLNVCYAHFVAHYGIFNSYLNAWHILGSPCI